MNNTEGKLYVYNLCNCRYEGETKKLEGKKELKLPYYMKATTLKPPKATGNETVFFSFAKNRWFLADTSCDPADYERLGSDGVGMVNPGARAMNKEGIIIIDDFYLNPEAVREEALQDDYRLKTSFTTFRSPKRTNAKVIERISELTGMNLSAAPESLTGTYKIDPFGDAAEERTRIHADRRGNWAGLVYLNTPEQCKGGTNLYRHKRTGYKDNLQVPGIILKIELFYDGHFEDRWQITDHIPMKFNRLAIYNAHRFHRETCFFGRSIEDARLVQTFFLRDENYRKV
ncbi:hypothetical protein [Candidatus Thiosymbion oneisti]|uniref:hypothetical protein n=1 Tax=Candidatus Thiosymbion oneisti TaxID=589554 RepID=UPI0010622667|nr:hypothetical protein [Candidatus Thiosymbion oneisti]